MEHPQTWTEFSSTGPNEKQYILAIGKNNGEHWLFWGPYDLSNPDHTPPPGKQYWIYIPPFPSLVDEKPVLPEAVIEVAKDPVPEESIAEVEYLKPLPESEPKEEVIPQKKRKAKLRTKWGKRFSWHKD